MFKLDQHQVNAMGDAFKSVFVADTIAHIRAYRKAWAQSRSDEDIAAHIAATMKFAHAHGIRNASSLQRLAVMKIDLEFDSNPKTYPRTLLRATGFSEHERIANFDTARRKAGKMRQIRL